MSTLTFQRDIPVRHTVDVCVAGGGPAGIAAAVAAARQGARVLLLEGQSCFGGLGTAGLIPAFMTFHDRVHFTAAGIGREVYDRLFEMGGAGPEDQRDAWKGSVAIRAEVLKRLYDLMLTEAGAEFLLQTQVIAVEEDTPGHVSHIVCAAKSGVFAVAATVFVDGTGDGDLCAWAGAPFEKGDAEGRMMAGTLCSLWTDIDWATVRGSGIGHYDRIGQALEDGVFSQHDPHLPGFWRVGAHTGGGNIGHTYDVDGTDERSLTPALVFGRKLLQEYERFYKEYLKGYEQMELVATGSLLGIRETRRILGDYVLNVDDYLARAVFDDEIGRYNYGVDIHAGKATPEAYAKFHEEHKGATFRYEAGETYGIPYRILLPRALENVYVTGRCVSTDRYVQSSIRVMPGCYITGQAAGIGAALAARGDGRTRGVQVREVQRRLVELGAYLPNCAR